MSRTQAYTTTRVPYARATGISHAAGKPYTCPELGNTCHRPGAQAGHQAPSRVGNTLRYRDGSVTDLNGRPLAA